MKNSYSDELEFESPDDQRLFYSAGFVVILFSLAAAHLYTKTLEWSLTGSRNMKEIRKDEYIRIEKEKIYEVLLEQEYADPTKKEEFKALSDRDAAGTGGITKEKGFHTNSPFREFVMGVMPKLFSRNQEKNKNTREEETYEVGIYKSDPVKSNNSEQNETQDVNASPGQMTKIPFNYRFQQDFLFRWDGLRATSLPRKKLAGYQYFKNMLKQVESSFAPPGGGNFAYRDMAGTVIREGIIPGETKIIFMLSESGKVLDVRQSSTQGQEIVDRACLEAIRGQNFGPVPEEVKINGLIFGINFIFPGRINYR